MTDREFLERRGFIRDYVRKKGCMKVVMWRDNDGRLVPQGWLIVRERRIEAMKNKAVRA